MEEAPSTPVRDRLKCEPALPPFADDLLAKPLFRGPDHHAALVETPSFRGLGSQAVL